MSDKVFEVIAANGVWAVLFFFLLMYQLAENKRREEKYLKTIDSLSDKFELLQDVDLKLGAVQLKLEKLLESNMRACRKKAAQ